MLSQEPQTLELAEVVHSMPRNKAPGLDAFNIESVQTIWSFLQYPFSFFIHLFWESHILPELFSQGVIRLLPKHEIQQTLGDYRPITLLSIHYKIIAKLLALRLALILPTAVPQQQSGFVRGRSTLDNIYLLLAVHNRLKAKHQAAAFVQLDLDKVYDRLSHQAIWLILAKLGCGTRFIQLLKGLTIGATATIHSMGIRLLSPNRNNYTSSLHSDQGKSKVHLVRWDLIARPVQQGGLGLVSMEITNRACFARAALHFLIAEEQKQWMTVAEDTLSSTNNLGGRTAMLLNTTSHLPKLSFIGTLQSAWRQISHKLLFTLENAQLPTTLKPYQLISLCLHEPLPTAKRLANSLRQVGLTTTLRIWEFRSQLVLLLPESTSIHTLQETLLRCQCTTSTPLPQNIAWTWEGQSPGLQLANPLQQFKRWMLDTTDTTPQQYSAQRWQIQWTDLAWHQWIAATTSNWHPRDTAWLWRLAFAAFYTGEWAGILHQPQTKCTWCDHDPESIQHLFLTCPRWTDIWSQVKRLLPQSEHLQTGSLLHFLAQTKQRTHTRAAHPWHLEAPLPTSIRTATKATQPSLHHCTSATDSSPQRQRSSAVSVTNSVFSNRSASITVKTVLDSPDSLGDSY
ncbi:hypothetical protein R1sor_025301 [Riccia sorocarpa]|uniref:Reverse transcriptase domain-containing protein n=1 Tax=Riccia sorocarpa TaxID=122646 RepID=A0ABD3G8S0_9MARC